VAQTQVLSVIPGLLQFSASTRLQKAKLRSSTDQTNSILVCAGVTAACSPVLLLVRALKHGNIQLGLSWDWAGRQEAHFPGLEACSEQ